MKHVSCVVCEPCVAQLLFLHKPYAYMRKPAKGRTQGVRKNIWLYQLWPTRTSFSPSCKASRSNFKRVDHLWQLWPSLKTFTHLVPYMSTIYQVLLSIPHGLLFFSRTTIFSPAAPLTYAPKTGIIDNNRSVIIGIVKSLSTKYIYFSR